MTKDDVIRLAKEVGFEMHDSCVLSPQVIWYIYQEELEAFAKLVAEHEREACANVCEEKYYLAVADAIRARGEA